MLAFATPPSVSPIVGSSTIALTTSSCTKRARRWRRSTAAAEFASARLRLRRTPGRQAAPLALLRRNLRQPRRARRRSPAAASRARAHLQVATLSTKSCGSPREVLARGRPLRARRAGRRRATTSRRRGRARRRRAPQPVPYRAARTPEQAYAERPAPTTIRRRPRFGGSVARGGAIPTRSDLIRGGAPPPMRLASLRKRRDARAALEEEVHREVWLGRERVGSRGRCLGRLPQAEDDEEEDLEMAPPAAAASRSDGLGAPAPGWSAAWLSVVGLDDRQPAQTELGVFACLTPAAVPRRAPTTSRALRREE